MSTFQKLAVPFLLFFLISSVLVKFFYEHVYYNLHNGLWFSILPQVNFLLHANIKTAFTDYNNCSETDFYGLKELRCPLLSFMEIRSCVKAPGKQVCLGSSVIVAKHYPGTSGKTGYKWSSWP